MTYRELLARLQTMTEEELNEWVEVELDDGFLAQVASVEAAMNDDEVSHYLSLY